MHMGFWSPWLLMAKDVLLVEGNFLRCRYHSPYEPVVMIDKSWLLHEFLSLLGAAI